MNYHPVVMYRIVSSASRNKGLLSDERFYIGDKTASFQPS